jgi:glycosyltransferase involved in cell wall biosynthesis
VTNRLQEDIPLLVVGDDQQLPDYGRALRSLAGPRVRFEPPVADPNVLFGLMSSALCLLFPSLLEAMSMVLLEAASLGVPIVCSDIPENRSVLGEEAVYFESGNVESLMHKIEWALTNYEDILMISKKVQEKVQTEYCWDTIAARYAELYREVTQERVIGSSEPV